MLPSRLIVISCCAVASLLGATGARAEKLQPSGFHFASAALFVHERDGQATVTVLRGDTSEKAWVRYIALPLTASANQDYTPVKDVLAFARGQSSASFVVPIVDHGVPALPRTLRLALFGAYPTGLGIPSSAVLTIINDDPLSLVRDVLNPLGLASPPPPTNPLVGARFYIDQVCTHRFGGWDGPDPAIKVAQYVDRTSAEQPGTVPMLATYRLVNGHCGGYADSPAEQASYHRWITSFAEGIGAYRAIVFLEMDSIITVGCLSRQGVAVRMGELHDAINILSQLPRAVVYLDAGAADAVTARQTASLLRRAGVAQIQGFFLNATHFDWTSREIRFGEAISRMTGGKHFVVNTGENGRGPLVPRNPAKNGTEVLCNPPGRGLGPLPTFNTGYPNVDAFAWTSNPGESGGACVPGAPPTGVYWPAYAMALVRHADFRVR